MCIATLAAACGSPSTTADPPTSSRSTGTDAPAQALPAAVQALEITGTEYAFAIDTVGGGELRPGWTKLTFHNEGEEAHQVMFATPKEGVDLSELAATAGDDSSGSKAIAYVDMLGGVSYIGPGQTIEAMVDLPAGTVLAMCYVPDEHGVAHALSGMTTLLAVGEATPGETAGTTTVEGIGGGEAVLGTITMGADGYELPEQITTGWYRVVNGDSGGAGEGLHELSILGLDEPLRTDELDRLLADLAENAAPGIPLVALGGMGALTSGLDSYLYLDLEPGAYLAVDFMPDPGDPRPHLLDGYVTAFEVGAS